MPANVKSILGLEVPLIVQIGTRQMSVKDLMQLAPGDLLELPKHVDDELEILIDAKPIGSGTAVQVGENLGVRVKHVGNVAARIAALGS